MCFLVLFVANIASADITTGLVLHLEFENNLLDSTANNNNGTKMGVGAATYDTHSGFGKYLNLDGTDDYVLVLDDDTLDFGSGSYAGTKC